MTRGEREKVKGSREKWFFQVFNDPSIEEPPLPGIELLFLSPLTFSLSPLG
jgi:hypothetical protein